MLHFATFEGIVQAIDDVSLDIYKGESLGLVGETGCGKTVTSRCITRLLAPNAMIRNGTVYFEGREIFGLSEEELREIRGKEISMIFQEPLRSLNPTMPVVDQIFEALLHQRSELVQLAIERIDEQGTDSLRSKIYKGLLEKELKNPDSLLLKISARLPLIKRYKHYLKDEQRIIRMLENVDIADPKTVIHQYPHELSGGMRQRVMIAMAMSSTPKLLIADEPTTAVDVTIQVKVLKLMKELIEKSETSILLITHNLGLIAEICERVAIMYAGSIVETCDVYTLFENPQHPYTQGLINAVPKIGRRQELQGISGTVPNLLNPPSGCRFHPRCPYAMDVCQIEKPEQIEIERGHTASCHLIKGPKKASS